jgi:hypothetical protein
MRLVEANLTALREGLIDARVRIDRLLGKARDSE